MYQFSAPIFQHLIEKISGFTIKKSPFFYYKKSIFRAFGALWTVRNCQTVKHFSYLFSHVKCNHTLSK